MFLNYGRDKIKITRNFIYQYMIYDVSVQFKDIIFRYFYVNVIVCVNFCSWMIGYYVEFTRNQNVRQLQPNPRQ